MSGVVESGAHVRFVPNGRARGLYLDGNRIKGVLSIAPNLFPKDGVATATIELAVASFVVAPMGDDPEGDTP